MINFRYSQPKKNTTCLVCINDINEVAYYDGKDFKNTEGIILTNIKYWQPMPVRSDKKL